MANKKLSAGWIIVIIAAAIFIGIQFFGINRSVPSTDPGLDLMSVATPPERVRYLIHQGCYDCHSYETKYPWYSYIQPVSWFLQNHIDEAREHMNFSKWGTYSTDVRRDKLEHAGEMVEKRKMPLWSFRLEHPEARMTDKDIKTLTTWFSQRRDALKDR